ncbi:hypothetical protein [Streptomyces sp. NPDC058401]|uniref:hypothetical protein n=1 Tax=Streptomyces sp. NPDC058401 TaxID=3346480 RepID=UPI00365FEEDC
MRRIFSALAAVTLLALVAGCGGDGGDAAPGKGSSSKGETAAGVGSLTATEVQMAMPSGLAAPQGWTGARILVLPEGHPNASQGCQHDTSTTCAGLGARGDTSYDKTGVSEHQILFTVMSFDTQENARVAMKGLVARVPVAEYPEPPKPIDIKTGAEETHAFSGQTRSGALQNFALMRIGNVVAQAYSVHESAAMLEEQAARQIERIKLAAAGKNPDA